MRFATTALLLCLFLFAAAGCVSAKMRLSPDWNPGAKPSIDEYVDYWWWGFRGEPEVNLQKLCVDQKPLGFRRYKSAEDIVITVITLGIYTPATVRVWCGG